MDILWKTLCAASAAVSDYRQPACHNGRFKIGDEDGKSLNLTHEWDKVFPLSNKVNHRKGDFTNRYGVRWQ